jgi:hypothetical protein
MSVHLYLGNLLLTVCITLMKHEYLQLYSLLTLLLRLGQNRLGKLSLVNEELGLPYVRGMSIKYRYIMCRSIGKFFMLNVTTLPSTLILYL